MDSEFPSTQSARLDERGRWPATSEAASSELDSLGTPLEMSRREQRRRQQLRLSLFWRTFFLLAALLLIASVGWYQLLRILSFEPRVFKNTDQIAASVMLARAALENADPSERAELITAISEREKARIVPLRPDDLWQPFDQTELEQRIGGELIERLGPGTAVASCVNLQSGLWVSFAAQGTYYWMRMDQLRTGAVLGRQPVWLLWLAMLTLASLAGAALIARLINRPLKQLAQAAAMVRKGNYTYSRLDEDAFPNEIRAVNIGFNRMAEQLSKVEQDRAEMLAGVSHDLRTPLARLWLEAEMNVPDARVRERMASDIEQVDGTIDKFLDYARPARVELLPVDLVQLVHAAVQPFAGREDIQVQISVPHGLRVLGDEVELSRMLSNLLENALRYGKTPGTSVAHVRIAAAARDAWVTLRVRDRGPGVPPEQLEQLTRPFYRGDSARTSATGAGLGLAIVAKIARNMGGSLELGNSASGGLLALVRLRQAAAAPPARTDGILGS